MQVAIYWQNSQPLIAYERTLGHRAHFLITYEPVRAYRPLAAKVWHNFAKAWEPRGFILCLLLYLIDVVQMTCTFIRDYWDESGKLVEGQAVDASIVSASPHFSKLGWVLCTPNSDEGPFITWGSNPGWVVIQSDGRDGIIVSLDVGDWSVQVVVDPNLTLVILRTCQNLLVQSTNAIRVLKSLNCILHWEIY